MVFNDYDTMLVNIFIFEWNQTCDSWADFITRKDLGIRYIESVSYRYLVIDEKKWMLAKIKYGI